MDDREEIEIAGELEATSGISRAKLLAGGVAGLGALALTSGLGARAAIPKSVEHASAASPGLLGPKRTVIWAIAAIAPWNEPVDVGFNNAARIVGWDYRKVGVPIAQYSAESHVNVIKRAILTKPDVLVTSWWVKGVGPALADAQKAGIFVMSNDADNFREDRNALGIAHVGTDGYQNGIQLGERLADVLTKKGKKSGVVLFGNPYPGNENIEVRGKGIDAALKSWNKGHGTSFTLDNFGDQSDTSAATSSGLYGAKLTKFGNDLVAAAGVATGWPTIFIDALKTKGRKPGDVVLGAFRSDPPALKGVKSGWITASADESYYPVGFVTAMLAWQQLQRLAAPNDYFTGRSLIDKSNLAGIEKREAVIHQLSKRYGVRLS